MVDTNNLSVSTNSQTSRFFRTKRGVIRLGFHIKSKRAKLFRDWAEDVIINKLENREATPPKWLKDFQFKMEQELDTIKNQLFKLEKCTAILPENLEAFVYVMHNTDSDLYSPLRASELGLNSRLNTDLSLPITKQISFLVKPMFFI